jgi:hypothetical protein
LLARNAHLDCLPDHPQISLRDEVVGIKIEKILAGGQPVRQIL